MAGGDRANLETALNNRASACESAPPARDDAAQEEQVGDMYRLGAR